MSNSELRFKTCTKFWYRNWKINLKIEFFWHNLEQKNEKLKHEKRKPYIYIQMIPQFFMHVNHVMTSRGLPRLVKKIIKKESSLTESRTRIFSVLMKCSTARPWDYDKMDSKRIELLTFGYVTYYIYILDQCSTTWAKRPFGYWLEIVVYQLGFII